KRDISVSIGIVNVCAKLVFRLRILEFLMLPSDWSIETLWKVTNFAPNSQQEEAIRFTDGPLYLTAGPGSGKTRVLLWKTVNLIVFHKVDPNEIFLSTFTDKAAFQLREGLRFLLGIVSNHTDEPYDISQMYVGT